MQFIAYSFISPHYNNRYNNSWRTGYSIRIPTILVSFPNLPTATASLQLEAPTTSTPSSRANSAPSSPSSRPPSEALGLLAGPPPETRRDCLSPTTPPTMNSGTSATPSLNLSRLSEQRKNYRPSATASAATTMWPSSTPTSTNRPKKSSPTLQESRSSRTQLPTTSWLAPTVSLATMGDWSTPKHQSSNSTSSAICCKYPSALEQSTGDPMQLGLAWSSTTGWPSADSSQQPLKCRWWRVYSNCKATRRWRNRAISGVNDLFYIPYCHSLLITLSPYCQIPHFLHLPSTGYHGQSKIIIQIGSGKEIMINSFLKTNINRNSTYSPYFVNRPVPESALKANNQHKYRKYKLIILLIVKAAQRQMKDCFQKIVSAQKKETQHLLRMVGHAQKNLVLTYYLAFDRIKKAAGVQKSGQKFIKSVVTLLQRMQKYKLKQSFSKLVLYSARQNDTMISTYFDRRDFQFCRKMQTLLKTHKKEGFNAVISYAKFFKSYKKLRVIGVIHNRYQRHIKHTVFARLSRFLIAKSNKNNIDKEVKDLKVQLQDMTVQLQNKNESIQRLEDELQNVKVEQSNASISHNLTYGQNTNRLSRRQSFKSQSAKRLMRGNSQNNKSIHNQSGDNLLLSDMSIGSLLGNLNRSRYGSQSKFDASCQCTCGLKTKYLKYKSLNQSLKNQLQIVKEELQVAKDLNEHFTTQIKEYLTEGGNKEGDYQLLKKDYNLLVEERDQLRDKVFKYQKQISNLKSEFKYKMEEIYRKVRKGNI